MKKTKRLALRSLLFTLLSLASFGCYDGDDDAVVIVPPRTGFLTVEWSIEGAFSPSLCALHGASDFELVVYDSFGAFFSETQVPCEFFVVGIELPVDVYSADATLVDPADFAVSFTQVLTDLSVVEGTELFVSIDFPPDLLLASQSERAAAGE